ncbi:MAG: 4Fe-4S dicluster domain-containing protein, partial [Intestinibacter sp.]
MRRIIIDKDLCTGCKSCMIACMTRSCTEKHEFDSFIDVNKDKYFINLSSTDTECRNHVELSSSGHPVPLTCRHCDEPECVYTCMSGAMTKDPETGIVSYNKEKCGSCYMCVMK